MLKRREVLKKGTLLFRIVNNFVWIIINKFLLTAARPSVINHSVETLFLRSLSFERPWLIFVIFKEKLDTTLPTFCWIVLRALNKKSGALLHQRQFSHLKKQTLSKSGREFVDFESRGGRRGEQEHVHVSKVELRRGRGGMNILGKEEDENTCDDERKTRTYESEMNR